MPTYDVMLDVRCQAWVTIEADTEAEACAEAMTAWSYSDLQNGEAFIDSCEVLDEAEAETRR